MAPQIRPETSEEPPWRGKLRVQLNDVSLQRESNAPSVDLLPGAAGLEDCECLFTHLKTERAVAERYAVSRFLGIQQSLGTGQLDDANWRPGPGNLADGLTKA